MHRAGPTSCYSGTKFCDGVTSAVLTPVVPNLELIDPRSSMDNDSTTQYQAGMKTSPVVPRRARRHAIWIKAKSIWGSLLLWIVLVIFTIVYSTYAYQVLLNPDPYIGTLILSASNTNILVSILSQIFGTVVQMLFTNAFDLFRWELAARVQGV